MGNDTLLSKLPEETVMEIKTTLGGCEGIGTLLVRWFIRFLFLARKRENTYDFKSGEKTGCFYLSEKVITLELTLRVHCSV